ncbi:hypothetical protein SAMD00079811_82650 (plasmid) [Scytonema sp. HK-05]|nr:hypothetical protein SAMD00079811_82650 [Scytonema sp. HK-05]
MPLSHGCYSSIRALPPSTAPAKHETDGWRSSTPAKSAIRGSALHGQPPLCLPRTSHHVRLRPNGLYILLNNSPIPSSHLQLLHELQCGEYPLFPPLGALIAQKSVVLVFAVLG